MSFMDAKFSKWGEVATAVLPQSLAKRFARVMLTAVLAVSFLPVAAFADTGGDSELKGIKGKKCRAEVYFSWILPRNGTLI